MTITQSSESNPDVERTLVRLGYPSRLDRKDLWTKPRAALGISKTESKSIEVAYWEGLPRAVVACGIQAKDVLAYLTGCAFSQAPPVALVFDGSGTVATFTREENEFHPAANPSDWKRTLAEPPGCISPIQADKVIQKIADGNRQWFRDSRSKKVVGVLPRIFPEGTVVLYELLQNAADSGAGKAAFRLENDCLLFSHDGNPFTENDVEAISFVNSSTKPVDTIGFMGIGFKAAFEISDQPEIHSPPFCFRFDRRREGGELFPMPIDCALESPEGYSTTFRFPLKDHAKSLIANELARFDGRPLLYIGADLRRITTPNNDFHLRHVRTVGEVQMLEVLESESKSRTQYVVFSRELTLPPAALQEFAEDRKVELRQLEGRRQRVSIAVPLNERVPDTKRTGRLQVYLPTDVRLPVAFDVQGNFLVGASRKELRHASGPWNREHFQTLPLLVADLLAWAKAQAPHASNWASWYDFIPDWQELEEYIGAPAVDDEEERAGIDLGSAFAAELAKRKLIPAIDNQGSLIFVAPEDATVVDQDLEETLPVRDLSRLSGLNVIAPDLCETAKERLTDYLEQFGSAKFRASLEGPAWAGRVEAFSQGVHTRQGRRQLAKVLAYLERECVIFARDLDRCTIVLTQNGDLRAAEERDARKVHTLPDVDISFPTEELKDHYDVVHARFRRELSRPGEMELDPDITRDALKALQRVAPVLDAGRIAADIILPLFQGERWREVSDDDLFRYTRFLMQHDRETRAALAMSGIKVKVRGLSREYLPPSQVYFGREYSMDGERLDRLCADAAGVHFLSDDYLRLPGGAQEDWIAFFSRLGVTAQPRIKTSTCHIYEWRLDELRRLTEETERTHIHLRVGAIYDFKGRHYALDDFELDPPILATVRDLYTRKPTGWKDRIGFFANLLETGWADYGNKKKKKLGFIRYGSNRRENKRVPALTTFARFLRDEPWLPVLDDSHAMRPSELVLNTEENTRLADKETPLCYCNFSEPGLISFLEIKEHPPETTLLHRLEYAVRRREDDLNEFGALYKELASDPNLDRKALRAEFREHPLIFSPDHDPVYITSKEAVYHSRTRLEPRMAAIKDAYPDLEKFFTEIVEIPTEESLEHCVEFLRDYAWKARPSLSDNLRSAIESCYRQFFNHLNKTEQEAREEALASLKQQLGSPAMVFCAKHGWVDTTNTTVLYPDTPAYEGLLSDRPEIAIESHLKRLAQPLSELRPLLSALNLKPISEAIRRAPAFGEANPHLRSAEFGERLSLLVRKAVMIVEHEQTKTESTSRNISLFLQAWNEGSRALFRDVRFFKSPPIRVRDVLAADATLLRESHWRAYVQARADHLEVHISGDLPDVFDPIADQLRDILRLDLLPAGLRDEIASLVERNLARLERQQFEVLLNQCLREKGFVVEENDELQRIERSATQTIEAAAQADPTEHAQDPRPRVESHFSPTSVRGGGSSGANQQQRQPPPEDLTHEEILEQLPEFDETSYGSDSVVDLSDASQWKISTQQSGLERGGGAGSGGGESFRNAQAYRDAYGKRGEQWVVEQERRALMGAGRPDLAERVFHKSETHEGSPWDIESFEKSEPHQPIYVEVKSTSEADNFEVDMSIEQIRAALRPSPPYYYLYRVVKVHTSKPTVYIYNFKAISHLIQFSATNVSATLPRPEQPEP